MSLYITIHTPTSVKHIKYNINLIETLYFCILQGVNLEILDPWTGHSSVKRESLGPFGSELMRSDLAHKPSSLPPIITKPVTIF